MEQIKLYCVIYKGADKKDKSVYVCARTIEQACVVGNKYLRESDLKDCCIKQVQECKIHPYICHEILAVKPLSEELGDAVIPSYQ